MVNRLTLLLFLWVVPIFTLRWALRRHPTHVACLTGASFGAIICLASLGLYSLYFTGAEFGRGGWPLAILGVLGLSLSMLHGSLPYAIGTAVGLIPVRTVLEGPLFIRMSALEAVVWALLYAALGAIIDLVRRRSTRQTEIE